MPAVVLQPQSAAIIIGAVAQPGRHREFVVEVLNPRLDSVAARRIAFVDQVRNHVRARKHLQVDVPAALSRIETLLVESRRREWIREGGQRVKVRDVSVVGVKLVQVLLAHVQVSGVIRVAAPRIRPRIQPVE